MNTQKIISAHGLVHSYRSHQNHYQTRKEAAFSKEALKEKLLYSTCPAPKGKISQRSAGEHSRTFSS